MGPLEFIGGIFRPFYGLTRTVRVKNNPLLNLELGFCSKRLEDEEQDSNSVVFLTKNYDYFMSLEWNETSTVEGLSYDYLSFEESIISIF